jgi:hypothetical protein
VRETFITDRWILQHADLRKSAIHSIKMDTASCRLQQEDHSQHKDGYCILHTSEREPFIADRWILHPADFSKSTIHNRQMDTASFILQQEDLCREGFLFLPCNN